MLLRHSRILIICLLAVSIIGVLVYGLYSRRKYRSFLGSGRVPEIQEWSAKATVSWVASIILSLLMIAQIMLEE